MWAAVEGSLFHHLRFGSLTVFLVAKVILRLWALPCKSQCYFRLACEGISLVKIQAWMNLDYPPKNCMALPFSSGGLSLSLFSTPGHTSLSSFLCSAGMLSSNIHFLCLGWKPSESSFGFVERRFSYLAFTCVSSICQRLGWLTKVCLISPPMGFPGTHGSRLWTKLPN